MIPSENSEGELFSGIISITDLKGNFINAFKVENGLFVSRYKRKVSKKNAFITKSGECDEAYAAGIFCQNLLEEVIVTGSGGGGSIEYIYLETDWGNITGGSSNSDSGESWQYASGGGGNSNNDADDKIDSDDLTGKAKCLNNSLTKNGNTFVKDLLANFKGDSEFDINISSKDKVYSKSRKIFVNGQTSYKDGDKTIYITISEDKISNEPVLSGIRTILHEYIHADIFRKLNTKYNSQDGIKDFKKTYETYKLEKHHNSMASLYINSMTKSLKEIHKNILSKEYNYLSNNDTKSLDDMYEALAWQGLKNHKLDAWQGLGKDTTRINTALTTYFHSLTKNCPE